MLKVDTTSDLQVREREKKSKTYFKKYEQMKGADANEWDRELMNVIWCEDCGDSDEKREWMKMIKMMMLHCSPNVDDPGGSCLE